MIDPTGKIVKHVIRTRYEDLPSEAVEVAKKAIIDTVGTNIAGSSAPLGKMVAEMVKDWGGKKQSTVLVYGDKVPAQEAAFANAIMARCLELDDVHEGNKRLGGGNVGHVSVMIVPPALAILESSPKPISGKKLILAIAIGSDLVARLRVAAGEAGRMGWMAETVASLGVVATVAKLLDLGEEVIANAMGAAYAFCSGNNLSTGDGTWDVWLPAGICARAGMVAVDMARRGYLGSKSPLLSNAGLYPLYFRNEYHENILLSDLGKVFEGANVSIKPYSSCKMTHHAIYTTLELVKKHNLKAEQIKRIGVKTCTYEWQVVGRGENKYAPQNVCEAQFSTPFTMAAAIVKGAIFPDILTESTLRDPQILELARKITVETTTEKDEIMRSEGFPPDDVDIYTTDGKVYSGSEPFVKGHPQNAMSFAECAEKFQKCVKLSAKPLSKKSLDEFLKQAERLEKVDDARGIVSNLS